MAFLFPVVRDGSIVGQVRTVVERAGVTGDFKEFIRIIFTFIQVYLFSVYQGVGRFAGERTAVFEQEVDSLQGAHGVEQSGRNALQASKPAKFSFGRAIRSPSPRTRWRATSISFPSAIRG